MSFTSLPNTSSATGELRPEGSITAASRRRLNVLELLTQTLVQRPDAVLVVLFATFFDDVAVVVDDVALVRVLGVAVADGVVVVAVGLAAAAHVELHNDLGGVAR